MNPLSVIIWLIGWLVTGALYSRWALNVTGELKVGDLGAAFGIGFLFWPIIAFFGVVEWLTKKSDKVILYKSSVKKGGSS